MKNKPVFSLSKALMAENIKMYWYLPVLSFITYFMAGIFPLLVDDTMLTVDNHWYLDNCLNNWNVAFVVLLIAVPLIASMLMMGYLHNPVRAIAVHAQPFSRNRIFCTHTLTGWLMCVAPVAVTALLYLLVAGRGTQPLYWLAMSVILITFFYGLFTLAGALTGTAVMHLLLSGVFFGIVPLVTWISIMYCEGFLTGFYATPDWVIVFMRWSNPLLAMLMESGGTEDFTAIQIVYYAIAGLVMLVLAYVSYSRAKLEHVGDSILYRVIEDIITWAIVFVGMAAFGYFFFEAVDNSMFMLLIGMAFGTLLTFVVVKIVLERSIRIISKKNFVSLGIYVLLAALFTGVTVYDITGFAKKVPAAEDVVSAERYSFEFYGNKFYYRNFVDDYIPDNVINEPETIALVLNLHKYIVENNMYDRDNYNGSVEIYHADDNIKPVSNLYMTFDYTLKDGRHMQRRFEVALDQNIADMINAVITSKEFKDDGNLSEKIKAEDVQYIQLHTYDHYVNEYMYEKYGNLNGEEYNKLIEEEFPGWSSSDVVTIVEDTEEIEEFLAALRKDYNNRTYTFKPSGATVVQTADTIRPLSIDGEIVMKKDSEGTRTSMQVTEGNAFISTFGGTAEIYDAAVSSPGDLQAVVSFSVKAQDGNTLDIMKDLYERKGYDYYADRIEEYR